MHSNLLSDNKGALGRKTVLRSLQIIVGWLHFSIYSKGMIIKPRQHYHVPIYQRKELVSYRLPVVCAAVLPSVILRMFSRSKHFTLKKANYP